MTISRRQMLTGSALATFGLLLSHPSYAAAGLNARLATPVPQPPDLRSVAALDAPVLDVPPVRYQPASPLRLVDTHALSDDYFVTDLVTVNLDTTGGAAADEVQVITRRDGSVEALVLSQQDNRIYHLRRDTTSPSGWSYVPLCGGDSTIQITQIAAGYDRGTDVVQVLFREVGPSDSWLSAGYFGDDNVWRLASGSGWYSGDVPGHPKAGRDDRGALFFYVWGSTAFYVLPVLTSDGDQVSASYTTVSLSGYVPTPEVNWIARLDGQDYAWCTDGANFCTITPDHVGSYRQGDTAQQLWAGVVQPAPLDDGTTFDPQAALVWSDPTANVAFSGANFEINGDVSKLLQDPSQPDSDIVVTTAVACVISSSSSSCQAYIVGADNVLYTQIPGYDATTGFPDPTPLTPLLADVVAVYAPLDLTDDLTLLAVGTDTVLRILTRSAGSASTYTDATTGQPVTPVNPANGPWAVTQVHRASEQMFRTTCWRTELTVLDASGVPAAGFAVHITPDVDVALWQQAGNTQLVAGQPSFFTAGPDGKITLAAPAFGLHTAAYTVESVSQSTDETWAPDGVIAATVFPDGEIHDQLAGVTTDTDAVAARLSTAVTATGAPLFPGLAAPGAPTPAAVAGFLATAITAGRNPTSAPATLGLAPVVSTTSGVTVTLSLSGWWDQAKKDAESAFRAVETGVVAAADHVCAWSEDLGHWVAGLNLGGWIQDAMNWVVTDIKSAMHAVTSLLRSLGAELDDLLHWLKDELLEFFADVGRATTQLYTWMTVDIDRAVKAGIDQLRTMIDATFFTPKGTAYQSSMSAAASDSELAAATFGSLRDNPPSASAPAADAVSSSDLAGKLRGLIHDARANWLMDKVKSHQMVDPEVDTDLGTVMAALIQAFDDVDDDLKRAFDDIVALVKGVLSDATGGDSLDALQPAQLVKHIADELVTAACAALDGILKALCELATAGWSMLMGLLTAPLDSTFGFLSPVLDLLGIGDLTVGQLMCGLVAVPGTVAGRIVFDGGDMFGPKTTGLTATDSYTNLIGLGTIVVEIVDIIINAVGDLTASAAFPKSVNTPTVLFAAGMVFSILGNGFGYPFSSAPGVDWKTPQTGGNGDEMPLFAWILGFMPAILSTARQFGGGSADDISRGQSWLTTLFGAISLGFAIDASVDSGASPAAKAIAVLGGLNTACTALDQFAEASAGATLIAKLLLDVVCPLGVVGAEVSVLMAAQ